MNNMDNLSADELLKRLKENMGEDVNAKDAPESAQPDESDKFGAQEDDVLVEDDAPANAEPDVLENAGAQEGPLLVEEDSSGYSDLESLENAGAQEEPLLVKEEKSSRKAEDDLKEEEIHPEEFNYYNQILVFDGSKSKGETNQKVDNPTGEYVKVAQNKNENEDTDSPTKEIPNVTELEAPDMEAFAAAEKDESEMVLDAVEKAADADAKAADAVEKAVDSDEKADSDADAGAAASENSDADEEGEKVDPSDIGIVVAVEGMDKAIKRFGADKVREAMNALNLSGEDIPELDEDADDLNANPSGVFLGDEYEREEQIPEIYEKYKSEKARIKLRLLGSAVFALCLLIFENLHLIGVNLPGAFNANAYPAFHVFISLQLLVLAAALSYKEIIAGARKTVYSVFDSNTVALFAVGITVICDLLIAFFGARGEFRLYNFAAVAVLMFCAAHDYLDIRREINSFDVVSSKKPKFILTDEEDKNGSDNSLEIGLGRKNENKNKKLNVKKVKFATKYFERTGAKTDVNKYTPYFIFGAIAVSVIFAIIAGVKTKDAGTAFAVANLSALMCMPMSVFCTSALPLFIASKQSHENGSAIIGESAVDEYADTSTVVFDDVDIFPARSVKVKSLKMYGDTLIDEILCDITGVYSKLGGPLFDVLSKATAEIGMREGMQIVECSDGGVSARSGEKSILIGNDGYMKQNDIMPTYDYEDEIQLASGNVRIMFVAYDGKLVSKMYIQYVIDPDFDGMLRRLHKNGMNVIIKTMDPNIDNALLVGRTRPANYPAKIERGTAEEIGAEKAPVTDSGIVSRSNIKSLISTLLICDRLRSVRFAANIIKIMSVAVAVIIMLIFALTGSSTLMLSLLVALYHLFWVLPVFAASKLCLK